MSYMIRRSFKVPYKEHSRVYEKGHTMPNLEVDEEDWQEEEVEEDD
jgi:hypothetical protein